MIINAEQDKLNSIMSLVEQYGGTDGAHHKTWVIDQIMRIITTDNYDTWVTSYCDGEDGPDTYEWDEGIAP